MSSQEEFIYKLNQINNLAQELTLKLELSRLTVNEHCSDLVREVDIATEIRIEELSCVLGSEKHAAAAAVDKLNDRRKKLLKEIAAYEAKCVASMEQTSRSKLAKSIVTACKWVELMRQATSLARYDMCREALNEQAESHACHLANLLKQLKSVQLGSHPMRFIECGARDDPSIGVLRVDKLTFGPNWRLDLQFNDDSKRLVYGLLNFDFKWNHAMQLF
jgi:hypothetical protein